MKNIKVLLIIAVLSSFYACEDAINIIQPGEINDPDAVYLSIDEVEKGLNSVYGSLSTESTIEFTSIFTDETSIGINNGGQGLNDGSYAHQLFAGSDAPMSIWSSNYATINFANRIIEAANKIEVENACEQARLDNVLAQLHAIRAFCHLQLESYFSTDMTNDAALGVIILDVVPPTSYDLFLPRSTNAEVFAFINDDLDAAQDHFDLVFAADTPALCEGATADVYEDTPVRITTQVITAIRARMAAFRGDYTNALTYADEVLAYVPIAARASYQAIWADTNNSGIVFKLSRVPGDFTIASYWFSQASNLLGSPFFEVSRSLYDSYPNGDIRKIDILDATSRISGNPLALANPVEQDVLILDKYPGSEGINLLNDIKVIRAEEMLMIKAEAYADAGALNGGANSVASTIRSLRAARFLSVPALPTYATATDAWKDILLERRREFAFEGHRYIDIRRLGVLAGSPGIERATFDCALYNACTLSATDYRFTLPIPTNELQANPSISGQQNPGY